MRPQQQTALVVFASVLGFLGLLAVIGSQRSPMSSPPTREVSEKVPLAGVVVVLDPGHGGADPGTTAGPISEAALTYRMAAELAASLKASGASVVFTVHSRCLDPALAAAETPPERPADAVMAATGEPLVLRHSPRPLWERAASARKVWARCIRRDPDAARSVFFVSLHFDQVSADTVQGGLICVDKRSSAVPALALALAEQMRSDNLCRTEQFRGIPGLSGRELGVLDPDYNPVPERVLLEIATLSNPENATEAGDPAWRGELVRRITLAITQTHQR